jgi:hypothetical protein
LIKLYGPYLGLSVYLLLCLHAHIVEGCAGLGRRLRILDRALNKWQLRARPDNIGPALRRRRADV